MSDLFILLKLRDLFLVFDRLQKRRCVLLSKIYKFYDLALFFLFLNYFVLRDRFLTLQISSKSIYDYLRLSFFLLRLCQ